MVRPTFGFSQALDAHLVKYFETVIENLPRPWVAAFDADGTLWQTDMGEAFFQYQIDHCRLPTLPDDPWLQYEEIKKKDHRQAYLWLAQINRGQNFSQVQKWAKDCVRRLAPIPFFEAQARLVRYLNNLDFEVYVVTASVQWSVVPAAALLGIPASRVLGIQTCIEDGVVTDQALGEITWREGKARALSAATEQRPVFCSGNTSGDEALLRMAAPNVLAVCSRSSVGELADAEAQLQAVAQEAGWLVHQF